MSVVIPAYNAERTIGAVLEALRRRFRPRTRSSSSTTARPTAPSGSPALRRPGRDRRGQSRLRGRRTQPRLGRCRRGRRRLSRLRRRPGPGWSAGFSTAARRVSRRDRRLRPDVLGARPWGWVAHLQIETPYLRRGAPARGAVRILVLHGRPARGARLRWDESYGGEDGRVLRRRASTPASSSSSTLASRGARSTSATRSPTSEASRRRMAYGFARCRDIRHGRACTSASRRGCRSTTSRWSRLPVIYRRLNSDTELRSRFLRLLPRMVVAEWTASAPGLRYAVRPRPRLRDQGDAGFR